MKQRIDVSQLQELSPEQQEKLREWWQPQIGDAFIIKGDNEVRSIDSSWRLIMISNTPLANEFCPLLSIGQMIEILTKESITVDITTTQMETKNRKTAFVLLNNVFSSERFDSGELVDALFEAVKEIL